MRSWIGFAAFAVFIAGFAIASARGGSDSVKSSLHDYIAESLKQFDRIPQERREALSRIAEYVSKQAEDGAAARLTFICTHNSRRSHMSQVWAQTAAAWYSAPKVETFSGGTEATAFNPRAVAALRRAGFDIMRTSDRQNPIYRVTFSDRAEPIEAFSKIYSQPPNPRKEFCAVMTCSEADESCPYVEGAGLRVAVPYEDPKAFDGTAQEAAKYDERCRQISREMLYLFSRVSLSTSK